MSEGKYSIKAETVIINEKSNFGLQANKVLQQDKISDITSEQREALELLVKRIREYNSIEEEKKIEVIQEVGMALPADAATKHKVIEKLKDVLEKAGTSVATATLIELIKRVLGI